MGKRKSSKKPQAKKTAGKLATTFDCLFCNHEKAVVVDMYAGTRSRCSCANLAAIRKASLAHSNAKSADNRISAGQTRYLRQLMCFPIGSMRVMRWPSKMSRAPNRERQATTMMTMTMSLRMTSIHGISIALYLYHYCTSILLKLTAQIYSE